MLKEGLSIDRTFNLHKFSSDSTFNSEYIGCKLIAFTQQYIGQSTANHDIVQMEICTTQMCKMLVTANLVLLYNVCMYSRSPLAKNIRG